MVSNMSESNSSAGGNVTGIRYNPQYVQMYIDSYFVVGLLTIVLNLCVIFCFAVRPRQLLKDGHHTLGMSISDAVAGLTVCVYYITVGKKMRYEFCCMANIAIVTSQCATIVQLMVICIERFNIFRKVGESMTVKRFQHPALIIVVWTFSLAMHVWPYFVYGLPTDKHIKCYFHYLFGVNFGKVGTYYAALFGAPLVAINLFYGGALVYLRKRIMKVSVNSTNNTLTSSDLPTAKSERKETAQASGLGIKTANLKKDTNDGTSATTSAWSGRKEDPTEQNVPSGTTINSSSTASTAYNKASTINSHLWPNSVKFASGNTATNPRIESSRKKLQKKVFVTFGLLLLTLNIVCLPRFALVLMSKRSTVFWDNLRMVCGSTNTLNSLFNPIIYAFRFKALREVAKVMLVNMKSTLLRHG